ncbi:hypothetical protein V8F33_013333 [Rhypophila sp. PSN 637]
METQFKHPLDKVIEQYPRGYPRLAALQGSDHAFLMFRRFTTLHSRILLLSQEELCRLESRLTEIDDAERTQLYISSHVHDENEARREVLREIREKLRAYDDDVHRFFRLCCYMAPSYDNIRSFSRWMDSEKPLIEPETEFLKNEDDFMAPDRDVDESFLEEAVEKFARKYGVGNRREHHRSSDPDLHYYSVQRKQTAVRLVLTFLASTLLLMPTIILYSVTVQDKTARLLVIAAFTLIFAVVIATLTRAKRHEIFASTAAFSAVLVVFIGSIPSDGTGTRLYPTTCIC